MPRPTPARSLTWFEQGFLLVAGQATTVLVLWIASLEGAHQLLVPPTALPWVAQGLGLLHTAAAALGRRYPHSARLTISACWIAAGVITAPAMLDSPLGTLTIVLSIGMFLTWLWNATESRSTRRRHIHHQRREDTVRGAALALGVLWFWGVVVGMASSAQALLAIVVAGATAIALQVWLVEQERLERRVLYAMVPAVLLAIAAWVADWPELCASLLLMPTVPVGVVLQQRSHLAVPERHAPVWFELLGDPSVTLVVTFLLLGLAGGLVLSSPVCSADGQGVGLLDAMFMSFSATCVTGLATLDVSRDLSAVGQGVILALVQLGGLGIMTFSTAGILLLRRRLSVRHERTVAELLGTEDRRQIAGALRRILIVTAVTEVIGTLVLWGLFVRAGDGIARGLWRGVFTAVSSFCNAGFTLQSDSLAAYASEPLVLHTVAVLLTVGALGPVALVALPAVLRGHQRAVELRLIYVTTMVLLVVPFVVVLAVELSNTLEPMSWGERLTHAWFYAVSSRTAGFNALSLSELRPATVLITMSLMFIGGSPGSTAGGVKTTTVALLALVLRAAVRGETQVRVFGFDVRQAAVYRSAAIVTMGAISVFAWMLMLETTQTMSLEVALFEVISALATVGLSLGGTSQLDSVGKVLIIVAMYAGRVGPLTLVVFLARRRGRRQPVVAYPVQDVAVG